MGELACLFHVYKNTLEASERLALQSNIATLKKYDFFFLSPTRLAGSSLLNELGSLGEVIFLPNWWFANRFFYNFMFKDVRFWEMFRDYNNLLICQLDALVLRNQSFHYETEKVILGGPIYYGFECPSRPLVYSGAVNGGFSLRNITKAIDYLKFYRKVTKHHSFHETNGIGIASFMRRKLFSRVKKGLFQHKGFEDIFWSALSLEFEPELHPTFQEAADFAFDAAPFETYMLNNNRVPFGIHAWEKYDKAFSSDLWHRQNTE